MIFEMINNNLFLIVLEAGKSKIKMSVDFVSGEGLLPDLYCVFTWQNGQGHSLRPHIKALTLFMMALPSGPNHLLRPHFQVPSHWGLGFSI